MHTRTAIAPGKIVVVHNGIIENYLDLKTRLQKDNHRFVTETDTEVIAHLVESLLPGRSFPEAVAAALEQLRGSFAVCLISADSPEHHHRRAQWPAAGFGDLAKGRCWWPPMFRHSWSTRANMYFMQDGEMAVSLPGGNVLCRISKGKEIRFTPQEVHWSPEMAEKGGYPHFMLKEIYEQPRSLQDTIAGRISLDTGRVFLEEARFPQKRSAKIQTHSYRGLRNILACGPGGQISD